MAFLADFGIVGHPERHGMAGHALAVSRAAQRDRFGVTLGTSAVRVKPVCSTSRERRPIIKDTMRNPRPLEHMPSSSRLTPTLKFDKSRA